MRKLINLDSVQHGSCENVSVWLVTFTSVEFHKCGPLNGCELHFFAVIISGFVAILKRKIVNNRGRQ